MPSRFKELGVEFIEQPLEAGDWEGMAEVYKHSTLPIMADESCIEMTDVARCKGYFSWGKHKINEMWRLLAGTENDCSSPIIRLESHGGLHDRVIRGYFSHQSIVALVRLCRYGWALTHLQRHRFRSPLSQRKGDAFF